jgi:hypothetical protein
MKKEVGGSAGILALLALILHTQFPGSQETVVSQSGAASTSRSRDKHQQGEDDKPREGPWVATRAFFNKGEAPRPKEEGEARQDSLCSEGDRHFDLACLTSFDEGPPKREAAGLVWGPVPYEVPKLSVAV